MSYVHASAFTSLADIRDRSRDSIASQRALSSGAYPKVINHPPSHTIQPYQISASMPAVSPEEQQARLETTYSTTAQVSAGSHGYPYLGAPGYPISSSAVASHDDKKNSWATSNLPLSKCPYSPLSMFPCGSGKTADRGDKVSTLKSWLYEHRRNPYPTKGEKIMLAVITKMTLTQVSTWFANARRRLKKDSKTTLPALDRCKDDDDDDDRNDDGNEVEYHEASRRPAASNVKSRQSLPTHLSTDTEAEKITALKESIAQNNEHHDGDEDDDCKHETIEDPSVNTDQNSPFTADSTQDLECSLPSNRPVLDMSDSHMPVKLSAGEKQHRGQPPIKIRCGRSGRDLKHQASGSLPNKGSPSGEKQNSSQVSSREVSSSTCGRPKIWSVTDFINTPLSTKLTTTSSLPTTSTTAAATSTWYSSLPSACFWTSNSLNPLMTTAAMLPQAHPKTSASQHHRPLSHEGIIHWPPSGASPFARLTSPYQPRSIPYPHAGGRLAVPISGQESTAAAGGQSWPALCLQTVYPMFPPRVVFSSP